MKSVQFAIAESGWESLQYRFELRGGDYDGRTEFVSFGTLDTWNGKDIGWSVERTIKFFQKLWPLRMTRPLNLILMMVRP